MTLAEPLQERLSSWSPAGDGRHTWGESFPDAGWIVHLAADHNDKVASLAWELTLTRTGDAPAGLTVRGWAERVVATSSGLMERLKLIEVDDGRGEAIVRSDTPTKKGPQAFYYEIKLTGLSRAVVRRFKADLTTGTREQVTFPVTHEVLAKLAGDIAG
jgi:hypothetical protein